MANSDQTIETPWDFLHAVEDGIIHDKFNWDLCASKENAKCQNYYTEKDNALSKDWFRNKGWQWLNHPFQNAEPWSAWAYTCSGMGAKIVQICPIATSKRLTLNWKRCPTIILIQGRIWPEVRDCMLSIWEPVSPLKPQTIRVWDWKTGEVIR